MGSVVFERGGGPLRPLFDALGEYRTHTMMSTGPGGVVVHNNANPGLASPLSCTIPLSGPSMTTPGFLGVQQADIFDALYSTSGGQLTGPEFLSFQTPMDPAFASAFGREVAFITGGASNPTPGGLTSGVFPGPNGNQFEIMWDNNPFVYDFHSFVDGAMLGMGEATPLVGAYGNGGVCSSTAAFMQSRTFIDQGLTYAGGWVQSKTYPHSLLYGGGSLGANGNDPGVGQVLFNSVYRPSGDFWTSIVPDVAFASICATVEFQNVMENAANQILNCVASNQCQNASSLWQSQLEQPSFVATSITDDTVGGWNGGPVWQTDADGQAFPQEGASVWAGGAFQNVQWSGNGTAIVCADFSPQQGPTGSTPGGDVSTSAFTQGKPTYLAITDMFPNHGPSTGGTVVTINGAGFSTTPNATQVYFGGYPAATVTCASTTQCTATTAAWEYPDFSANVDVVVYVGGQSSASAPLAPTFPFQYDGQPVQGCQAYWTCEGGNDTINTGIVYCPVQAGAAPFQLLRNGTPIPTTTSVTQSTAWFYDTTYAPTASAASPIPVTYQACFESGGQESCSPALVVNAYACTCVPSTCESLGVCNGHYSDGCGGTLVCGGCPTGSVCSSGPGTGYPTGTCFTPIVKGGGGCRGTNCQ